MDLSDVDAIEAVEQQLDQFIEKRAREARDAERVEEVWKESVCRDREKRRRRLAAEWYGFHEHMRELHQSLAAEHRSKAEALLEGPEE